MKKGTRFVGLDVHADTIAVAVARLRQRLIQAIRRSMFRYLDGADFCIVHISLQHNHIHLIVEASDRRALTRGMQSYVINTARAINRAWGREGKVFAYRYHASQIRTDRYARNALSYVLNNWRRHTEDYRDGNNGTQILDEYSSAISFMGWKGDHRFKPPPGYELLPVSAPQTELLQFDWEWFGLIDPWEVPGPMR
jgi:REP element-mobilizing transposase RayT